MRKFKLTHPALACIEGHDDVITRTSVTDKHGWTDETGTILVPGHMVVCPACGGTGSHVRRDIDDSRLVDMMQEDGDLEGIEDYFNGAYDVQCQTCHGANVILEPYWDQVPDWAQKCIEDWNRSERESQEEQDAERAMGA